MRGGGKVATNTGGGAGVHYFASGNVARFNEIVSSETKDLIVQKAIKQSPTLSMINASSVNTIRVLSLLKKDGTVKIYSCALRMGRSGSKVDNACSGGIICGICFDGRLKERAFSYRGECFEVHPSSNVRFSDIVIPNFNAVLRMTEEAHLRVPHFLLVSWDWALDFDKNNPILIEANLNFGSLAIHQLTNGPIFGEDQAMILNEVFGRKK